MLKNKVSLITGSSGGIGWEIAKIFAKNGAIVILNGRNEEKLKNNLAELNNISELNHTFFRGDVSDLVFVKELYQNIFKNYKKLDILVNNAGILNDALIGMITEQMVDELIAINQKAVIFNLQYAAKLMQRQKNGSIINISSIIGRYGNIGQMAYSATKSAAIGITYSGAKELALQNIRVNAIAPGLINTAMIKNLPEEKFEKLKKSILMNRIGEPEDVANVALFLASDLSKYVTGQVIGVDGGMII
ncbi:MAG: glucose 1-dehydrogenase [Ignavibacteriae bacterium]|nr:glucose 1-dehydrogenase [Ignavibacteriota bacterium]